MELFSAARDERLARQAPLAARMRPRRLEDVVGQDHLLGPDGPLERSIRAGRIGSMIFWGPPGTGKTTVARLVAERTGMAFDELSAVASGVAEVRQVIERAGHRLGEQGQGTLLFIDEIHRSPRPAGCPAHAVEDGVVVLVGATTENPHFEVIPALLSRCQIYAFHALTDADVRALIDRAIDRGHLREVAPEVEVGSVERDVAAAFGAGDARRSLNLVEQAVLLAAERRQVRLDLVTVETVVRDRWGFLDKVRSPLFFNFASAFIKSLRRPMRTPRSTICRHAGRR